MSEAATSTATDAKPQNKPEWVLATIREHVTAEADGGQNVNSNVWTSINQVKQDASSADCIERSEVETFVNRLAADGDIINWFGCIAPTDREHLQAIVACENQSEVPRRILLNQIQRMLGGDEK